MSREAFEDLRGRLQQISDLGKTMALLSWDQQVMMPRGGSPLRAEQLATVGRIAHERFTSPEIGRLLDDLREWGEQQEYDSFEASLIRVVSSDWEKARRVPADLRAEMSRSAALAQPVWVDARKNNDFASFLPVLRKNLDLRKRYIECFDVSDEPYDIVLDDFERGMKTAEVRRLFDYVKEHQAPLVKEVAAVSEEHAPAGPEFPLEDQKRFELEVARAFGFDDECWRLDPTVHPFASGTGTTDIRITTRYFPTTSTASSQSCTSSGTASTSARSTRRSSAHRSPAGCRSACTSLRAGCGRTWSGGRSRSGGTSSRASASVSRRVRRLRRRALVSRGQHRPAVADPRRGR